MADARRVVLQSIRDNLAASASHEPARRARLPVVEDVSVLTVEPDSAPVDSVARFKERLAAVGGGCIQAAGETEAAEALARILGDADAKRVVASNERVVASNAPLVARVMERAGRGGAATIDGLPREALFSLDAGVTTAQWGIAESGTLVLESAVEQHRLLSLVPPIHIALLPVEHVCDSLGTVLSRIGPAPDSAAMRSHAITLITGPSRSADIELTLTIGVHGPKALFVILVG
jgi:L-lactate dehydrogenase complex protein LldG